MGTILEQRTCKRCGTAFSTRVAHKRYCTPACRLEAEKESRHASQPYQGLGLAPGTVGAIGEMRVCADLLGRGYQVFRAVSAHCPCDLVALAPNGQLLKIEVRTASCVAADGRLLHNKGTGDFDVMVTVLPDGLLYTPPLP